MGKTTIEWCDFTFNPWIGCSKVSSGCKHCYAATYGRRFGVEWGKGKPVIHTSASNWRKPLAWNRKAAKEGRRYRVFCASLADVFDPKVPDSFRDRLFALIAMTPNLDWLLLTKRPEKMREYINGLSRRDADGVYGPSSPREVLDRAALYWLLSPGEYLEIEAWPLPNIWLGVTAENQEQANTRIPILLDTPAAKRFVSVEPMLGSVVLAHCGNHYTGAGPLHIWRTGLDGHGGWRKQFSEPSPQIDWVICGGESGPGARPMHPYWVRSLRDQCQAAGTPFLFKQWGEWNVVYDRDRDDPDWRRCPKAKSNAERYVNLAGGHGFHGERVVFMRRVGKKAAGRELDGQEHLEFPEND